MQRVGQVVPCIMLTYPGRSLKTVAAAVLTPTCQIHAEIVPEVMGPGEVFFEYYLLPL